MEQNERDLEILKALYYGNHLNDKDKERALKLVYLLDRELKNRIKQLT